MGWIEKREQKTGLMGLTGGRHLQQKRDRPIASDAAVPEEETILRKALTGCRCTPQPGPCSCCGQHRTCHTYYRYRSDHPPAYDCRGSLLQ